MSAPAAPSIVLDPLPFRIRVSQELARVRRSGGFVSLAVISLEKDSRTPSGLPPGVELRVSVSVRLQDVPGVHESGMALLMPDTSLDEGIRAAERILSILPTVGAEARGIRSPSVGVATVYGEVEGSADAFFAAAEEALSEAGPGGVGRSRQLEGRPRLLIVDDEPAFASALAELISTKGFEAHPCTYGVDALDRVAASTYSAVFVDLVLRDASGLDVARRALGAHPRRPVIMMSGYTASGEAVLDALSLGPVLFVRKPIEPLDLESALAMVRQLLPGSAKRREAGGIRRSSGA